MIAIITRPIGRGLTRLSEPLPQSSFLRTYRGTNPMEYSAYGNEIPFPLASLEYLSAPPPVLSILQSYKISRSWGNLSTEEVRPKTTGSGSESQNANTAIYMCLDPNSKIPRWARKKRTRTRFRSGRKSLRLGHQSSFKLGDGDSESFWCWVKFCSPSDFFSKPGSPPRTSEGASYSRGNAVSSRTSSRASSPYCFSTHQSH